MLGKPSLRSSCGSIGSLWRHTTSAKVYFCSAGIFLTETFLTCNFFLTVLPEASIDALKEQLANAQRTTLFFLLLSCFYFEPYQRHLAYTFFSGLQGRRSS